MEQLARHLGQLLDDPSLWETMARNARQAAEAFDWDPHLDKLEGILGGVVPRS